MHAAVVRKPFSTCQTLLNVRKSTQEKWVDSVKLKIPLTESHGLLYRTEFM